jgi:hypothetical protein
MKKILVHTKVDEAHRSHLLPVIKKNAELFVPNPHADITNQPALVQLDPRRIADSTDFLIPLNYRGLLVEIGSQLRP